MPSRPPSPSGWTPGTRPPGPVAGTSVTAPSPVIRTIFACSRRLTRCEPSSSRAMPQGTSRSVATTFAEATSVAGPGEDVDVEVDGLVVGAALEVVPDDAAEGVEVEAAEPSSPEQPASRARQLSATRPAGR